MKIPGCHFSQVASNSNDMALRVILTPFRMFGLKGLGAIIFSVLMIYIAPPFQLNQAQLKEVLPHIASTSATLLAILFTALALLFNLKNNLVNTYKHLINDILSLLLLLFLSFGCSTIYYFRVLGVINSTAPITNYSKFAFVSISLYVAAIVMLFLTMYSFVWLYFESPSEKVK